MEAFRLAAGVTPTPTKSIPAKTLGSCHFSQDLTQTMRVSTSNRAVGRPAASLAGRFRKETTSWAAGHTLLPPTNKKVTNGQWELKQKKHYDMLSHTYRQVATFNHGKARNGIDRYIYKRSKMVKKKNRFVANGRFT